MQKELTYYNELKKAMSYLAEHPKTLFIGQAVEFEGTGLFDSLKHLPEEKRIELPVAEYLQCGLANGMAIEGGFIPVSTFPRLTAPESSCGPTDVSTLPRFIWSPVFVSLDTFTTFALPAPSTTKAVPALGSVDKTVPLFSLGPTSGPVSFSSEAASVGAPPRFIVSPAFAVPPVSTT